MDSRRRKSGPVLNVISRHRNRIIDATAGTALVVWLMVKYVLADYGAIITGARQFAEVAVALCQALVASWIFHVLVVRTKERRDRRNTEPFILRKVADLLGMHHNIIAKLAADSGIDASDAFPSPQTISSQCDALAEMGDLAIGETKLCHDHWKDRIIEWHNLLYKVTYHLDTELILLMADIEDSDFMHEKDALNANSLAKYSRQVERLRDYFLDRFGLLYTEAIKLAQDRPYAA